MEMLLANTETPNCLFITKDKAVVRQDNIVSLLSQIKISVGAFVIECHGFAMFSHVRRSAMMFFKLVKE